VTDVLLGQSYFLRFDPKLWEAMQPYPPLGTPYAASHLRQRGVKVALFDAMLAESEAACAAAVSHHRPAVAVLSGGDWKLIRNNANDQLQLYNLARDQGEQLNLAGDLPRLTAELHARLHDLMDISGVTPVGRDGRAKAPGRAPDVCHLECDDRSFMS
jgi:arylsulfatase A-like enzyme